MATGRPGRHRASPLLRELRRWERRARRGELPARALVQAWLPAVAAARAVGDEEAPQQCARLGAILLLGVEAALTRLEEAIGRGRPVAEPALTLRVVAEMEGDLDEAADLGAADDDARARLAALLAARLEGRLLAIEAAVQADGAQVAARELSHLPVLWAELVEAEAHGAPGLEPLAARLANLQAGLEALAQAGPSAPIVLRSDPLAFLALASRAGSLGQTVLAAWAGSLARQFAGRPGWDEFVAELRAMRPGAMPPEKVPGAGTRRIGAAAREPLPPTLAAVLEFVRRLDGHTAGFVAGLLSGIRQTGEFSPPDMPLVQKTTVQLDWVAGEPDPWERGDAVARAQAAASGLLGRGVQVEFARGQPVPAELYRPSEARRAAQLSLPGARGPVVLEALTILDRAVPVSQRPGFLRVILAPAARAAASPAAALLSGARLEGPAAREVAAALAEPGGPAAGIQLKALAGPVPGAPPRSDVGGLVGPAPGRAATPPERVRVEIDWVAGQDPWRRKETLEKAREAARRLESRGVRLEFVRGREVPAERYLPDRGREAADFGLAGPRGRVSLGDLGLLERAMPLLQRPGFLHVLLAPPPRLGESGMGAEAAKGLPALAGEGEPSGLDAARLAAGALAGEPPQMLVAQPTGGGAPPLSRGRTRPERVRLELDWVAGHDPWQQREALAKAREVARSLRSRGVDLEFVRGREVPAERYAADRGREAADFSLAGRRGRVSLGDLGLLENAIPLGQRPGFLHVLLPPARRSIAGREVGVPLAPGSGQPLGIGRQGEAPGLGQPAAALAAGPQVPTLPRLVAEGGRPGAGRPAESAPPVMPPLGRAAPGLAAGLVAAGAASPGLLGAPGTGPVAGSRTGLAPEPVRVEVDWVAGQDPWRPGGTLAGALESARGLESQGVRLDFVRGREVPAERYVAGRGQPAGAFGVLGPGGPVSLGALRLLERAVPIRQRPGLLHVILAPASTLAEGPGLISAAGPAGVGAPPIGGPGRPGIGLAEGLLLGPGAGSAGPAGAQPPGLAPAATEAVPPIGGGPGVAGAAEAGSFSVGGLPRGLSLPDVPAAALLGERVAAAQAVPLVGETPLPTPAGGRRAGEAGLARQSRGARWRAGATAWPGRVQSVGRIAGQLGSPAAGLARTTPEPSGSAPGQMPWGGPAGAVLPSILGPGSIAAWTPSPGFAGAAEARPAGAIPGGPTAAGGPAGAVPSGLAGAASLVGATSPWHATARRAGLAPAGAFAATSRGFEPPLADELPGPSALLVQAGYAAPNRPLAGAPRPAGARGASLGSDALLDEPGVVLRLRREEVARAPAGRASGQAPSRPSEGSAARAASPSSADVSAPKQPNLDVLARQVYAIIKQRLAVERERVGGARGLRPW